MGDLNNIPKLRFPEFEEEWIIKPLIELSENGFSNGAFNDPKKVGSGYRIINVKDMYIDGTINVDNLTRVALDDSEFQKNRVEYGDLFFTRSSLVKEGIAYSNINLNQVDDLTYDGHLIRMRPNQDIALPTFLYYCFSTSGARIQFIQRGKTTTMTTIGQEDIATVEISFPTLPEQTKIANFLTAVDDKLSQLKKKKSLLEEYKKGVMQKIFSQELRFKDDNGEEFAEWEEKKLGEIAEFFKGKGLPKNDIVEDGEYKCIHYGELFTKYKEKVCNVISRTNKYDNSFLSIANDVLMPTSDVTPNGLATASCILEDNIILGGDVLIIRQKVKVLDGVFFSYYITNFRERVMKLVSGSTVYHLYGSDMKKLEINIPSFPEQTKIANFLSAIDDKINQCGVQIEKMEGWKKGLLQRMFV
ncbi:MAG: restriction endonuclease subunit S [Paludibacter sp.]|nr:restriction endonuclease subunit S [Paludibacter sp.]